MILLALLLGCEVADDRLSFEADIAPILWRECADCHSGSQPDGDLELWEDPYGAMVGVPSTQAQLLLVEPGDYLQSYLWHKLNGTQSIAGGSGTLMPLDGSLPRAEIDRVARWIDDGAAP